MMCLKIIHRQRLFIHTHAICTSLLLAVISHSCQFTLLHLLKGKLPDYIAVQQKAANHRKNAITVWSLLTEKRYCMVSVRWLPQLKACHFHLLIVLRKLQSVALLGKGCAGPHSPTTQCAEDIREVQDQWYKARNNKNKKEEDWESLWQCLSMQPPPVFDRKILHWAYSPRWCSHYSVKGNGLRDQLRPEELNRDDQDE